EEFRYPHWRNRRCGAGGNGIVEGAIGIKYSVRNDQRDLVLVLGKVERIFLVITDDIHPHKTRMYVESGHRDRVIVIPQRGRLLIVGIVTSFGSPKRTDLRENSAKTTLPDSHRSPAIPSDHAGEPRCEHRARLVRRHGASDRWHSEKCGCLAD